MEKLYKYIILDEAYQDIDNIFDYISNTLKAPQSALKLIDEFENKIILATENPNSYPIISNILTTHNYRRIVVNNYIIVYIVNELSKEIVVLRVLNSRQNWIKLLPS